MQNLVIIIVKNTIIRQVECNLIAIAKRDQRPFLKELIKYQTLTLRLGCGLLGHAVVATICRIALVLPSGKQRFGVCRELSSPLHFLVRSELTATQQHKIINQKATKVVNSV